MDQLHLRRLFEKLAVANPATRHMEQLHAHQPHLRPFIESWLLAQCTYQGESSGNIR